MSAVPPSVSVESHAHRLAKRLLLQWLRAAAAAAGWDEYVTFGSTLSWRVNRPAPHFGIWEEYPFLSSPFGATVWDERSDRWRDAPPTYAQLKLLGMMPLFIADIAIQHKGYIAFVVEVIHKHQCPQEKLDFYQLEGIAVVEVPTNWVLGQVGVPAEIPEEFFLW